MLIARIASSIVVLIVTHLHVYPRLILRRQARRRAALHHLTPSHRSSLYIYVCVCVDAISFEDWFDFTQIESQFLIQFRF